MTSTAPLLRAEEILDPATLADPYPFFAGLRAHDPVHWNEPTGSWYVARYRDVHDLLTDPRLGAPTGDALIASLPPAERAVYRTVEDFFARWMVFSDPPHQVRIRTCLQRSFTPAAVAALAPSLQRHAERAVAAFAVSADPAGDLIEDLARPFALDVVCDLLGIAAEERAEVSGWSDTLMAYLAAAEPAPTVAGAAGEAVAALTSYVGGTVLPRGQGLLARTLGPGVTTGELTPADAAATFAQLLTGGVEPVSTAAGVAVTALHAAPDQLHDLRAGRLPYEHAVEEALRFDPPFHFAPRQARASLRVGGRTIRAGDRVVLLLASANRDEEQFPRAGTYDARRGPVPHLAFGRGGHYCIGGVLARRQITTLLQELDRRLPGLRIDGDAVRRSPSFGSTVLRPTPCMI
ncbi:cytochrome P450 [Streptomyces cinnamoneus]|uniref:Cytochrome P450 n=1 Tax=Streptomyces cinnamoneus TaxID=53446 RepID=A0A918TIH0_STRCJ|nr:cytochrome P450 [Streptomyces cinnamoneus]GHC47310.1 cytochrome P450 [Streptomyces cinnamoneus]